MIKLESGNNGKPISFGQPTTSPTAFVNPDRVSALPFDIQQVPSRFTPRPLPASLRPDPPADADTSDSSRNFRGMIGIGVALLILFLLRG